MAEQSLTSSMVDDVIEAAIQAEMKLRGWIPDGSGGYTYVKGEWDTVHVPGPNGGATGDVQIGSEMPAGTDASVPITTNPSEEVYGPWRERITSAFQGWDDLPASGDFTSTIGSVRDGAEALSSGGNAGTQQPSKGGNTQLATLAFTMASELTPFSGDTVDTFSLNYVNKFQFVLTNQCHVAASIDVALLAEQKLWEEANASIVRIAEAAATAFEASVYGGGDGGKALLTVLGVVAGAASLYFTAGLGAALVSQSSTVLGIISGLSDLAPDVHEDVPLGGSGPGAVYDNLCEAITKLNDDIRKEEGRIEDTMEQVNGAIAAAEGDYDLTRPSDFFHQNDPGQFVTAKNEIALEAKTLTKIGLQYMPSIGGELRAAAKQVVVEGGASMWNRPGSIGLGYSGPSYAVAGVSDWLVDKLYETAQEMVDAGERLDIAARAFTQTDDQVRHALAAQSRQLDREEEQREAAEAAAHALHFPGKLVDFF